MKRKIGTYLMAFAVAAGLCGCGSKAKPEVSLIVKVPTMGMNCVSNSNIVSCQDFMDFATEKFAAAYESADVSMRVEVFDYIDESDPILGAYGTEEAADVLYEGYFNMAAYISEGHVVPLDDIITDEIRKDISESAWAQSMKNGKTYMMPYLSMQNILIYNKRLFMECGLERFLPDELEIQNWTIEEWEIILDTLAEKLPDGSYPMLMYGMNNQGDTHIMSLIRAFGSGIFDEDGNFDFESEEAVRGLEWIQGGVGRGWYPPHPENIELVDNQQLFENGLLGIYLFNNANFMLYDDIETDYGYVNFPGNIATSFITGFEVFDNGDPLKVQVSKDFVKFIYEDEELLELSAGSIPESRTVAAKYAGQIMMLAEFSANEVNVVDFMNNSPNWQGSENSVRNVFWPKIHELLRGRTTPKECAAALNQDCNAAIHVKTSFHE